MIRWLIARFGRRSFPLREYGPWHFGDRVTVYVGRRWRGPGRTFTERYLFRGWEGWLTVKVGIGVLLVCYDRRPWRSNDQAWLADAPGVDGPNWWGWRQT